MEKEKIDSIKKIQDNLIISFTKINEEFQKENIIWWAHSGTLLGIIRHNGKMIPWDDDIDMAMTYSSFIGNRKKIIEILKENNMKLLELFEEDNIYIKFISNNEYSFKYKEEIYRYKFFIDIMLTIPREVISNNSLKYNISTIPGRAVAMYNNKNIPSWYLHFLLPKKMMLFFIKNKFNKSLKYNSNFQIKYDSWMGRKIVYDLNNFELKKFYDTNVWINSEYKKELDIWYKNNWEKEIEVEPHIFKYKK